MKFISISTCCPISFTPPHTSPQPNIWWSLPLWNLSAYLLVTQFHLHHLVHQKRCIIKILSLNEWKHSKTKFKVDKSPMQCFAIRNSKKKDKVNHTLLHSWPATYKLGILYYPLFIWTQENAGNNGQHYYKECKTKEIILATVFERRYRGR